MKTVNTCIAVVVLITLATYGGFVLGAKKESSAPLCVYPNSTETVSVPRVVPQLRWMHKASDNNRLPWTPTEEEAQDLLGLLQGTEYEAWEAFKSGKTAFDYSKKWGELGKKLVRELGW